MQLVAEFIEFLIAPPRFQAANAIPVPTMARIKAYSAADAPLWSAHRLFKKVISFTPTRWERFPVALAQLHGRGLSTSRPRRRSEEHTSELQSLMRISYAVFCL